MAEDIDFNNELERAVTAWPFVPFTITTTSGARHFVPEVDWIFYTRDAVILVRPKVGDIMLRVYSIESIEFHESIK